MAPRARRDTPARAIDWTDVAGTVRAVVEAGPADEVACRRLVLGLSRTVQALDRLARLADAALDGDDHARAELRGVLADLVDARASAGAGAGSLDRARELEAVGFLQLTLAVGEQIGWTAGVAVVR